MELHGSVYWSFLSFLALHCRFEDRFNGTANVFCELETHRISVAFVVAVGFSSVKIAGSHKISYLSARTEVRSELDRRYEKKVSDSHEECQCFNVLADAHVGIIENWHFDCSFFGWLRLDESCGSMKKFEGCIPTTRRWEFRWKKHGNEITKTIIC